MGSPLSPVLAVIVMQDLENIAILYLPFKLSLYYRYVDGILLTAPKNSLIMVSEIFNSLHDRLKFTLKISDNNRISFLDVMISIKNDRFLFDIYRKPTFSGRFFSFFSNHPLMRKKGVIISLVDKVIRLSHPKFQEKNFLNTIDILLNNGYPLDMIFTTINKRINFILFSNSKSNNKSAYNKNEKLKFFTVPYVHNICERLGSIAVKHNFKQVFSCNNKLDKFIKAGKDLLDPMQQSGVV